MSTLRRPRHIPPELLAGSTVPALLHIAVIEWLWIMACWLAMALTPPQLWPLQALWIGVVAGRMQALGVVLHDACHLRRKHQGASARWLEFLAGYPICTTLAAMRFHHLRHHRDSCMSEDPYLRPGASERLLPALTGRLRGMLVPWAWIVRSYVGLAARRCKGLRQIYGRHLLGDRSGRDLRSNREIIECLNSETGQALFFVAVGLLVVWFPKQIALAYLAPLAVAGILNAHRVIAEHRHIQVHDRQLKTVLSTTRNHFGGCLDALIFYPRNIGYHVMHHLHPAVAWNRLPALHDWYARQAPELMQSTGRDEEGRCP